ncbi:MAG TPA: hypothetical protein VGR64_08215 [Terracidiphilus sp.]|nr:hypothetical protein [Terracidiphilus sp.]
MTALEQWLKRASRCLSADSTTQVRSEIEEHFRSAREEALHGGAGEVDAEHAALAALGDAAVANRHYRRVLLTKSEARLLRQSSWESSAVCSRRWLRWLPATTALITGAAGAAAWITGEAFWKPMQPLLLLVAGGTAMIAAPMFLPLYTPLRGKMYRALKWVALAAMLLLLTSDPRMTWMFVSSVGYGMWIEWKRASIRRKIPQAQWPKHLYL